MTLSFLLPTRTQTFPATRTDFSYNRILKRTPHCGSRKLFLPLVLVQGRLHVLFISLWFLPFLVVANLSPQAGVPSPCLCLSWTPYLTVVSTSEGHQQAAAVDGRLQVCDKPEVMVATRSLRITQVISMVVLVLALLAGVVTHTAQHDDVSRQADRVSILTGAT